MVFSRQFTPEEFNPDIILNSGQVFRMQIDTKGKQGGADIYSAYSGDCDLMFYYNQEKDTWDFVCDEAQWSFWQRYFDFETDYGKYNKAILESKDEFLKDSLKAAFGMRILRQDLWETFISYMVSQNNNIPKIKKTLNILCERYSDGIHFPKAEVLASVPLDELTNGTALGYRAEYLSEFSKKVEAGDIVLADFTKLSATTAYEKLLEIKGIGPKVANCILLYGLHAMDSYPVDTWMKKIITEDYGHMSQADYMSYINNSYSGYQGYIQQLQFYYKRHKK